MSDETQSTKTRKGDNLRGNSEWHRETGRAGGIKTKEKRGSSWYAEIGRKGGKSRSEQADMAELGRKGGMAKKRKPDAGNNPQPVTDASRETDGS